MSMLDRVFVVDGDYGFTLGRFVGYRSDGVAMVQTARRLVPLNGSVRWVAA